MTREDIKVRLAKIHDSQGDDEVAHSLEDDLRADFLNSIAVGAVPLEDIQDLAALVLTSRELDFERWCA